MNILEKIAGQGIQSPSSNNHNIVLEFLEPQGAKNLIPMGFEGLSQRLAVLTLGMNGGLV